MSSKIPIQELIDRCVSLMQEGHYSDFCITYYQSIWRRGICKHMQTVGTVNYSPPVGEAYITFLPESKKSTCGFPSVIRSIRILDSVLESGIIPGRPDKLLEKEFEGPFSQPVNRFIVYLGSLHRSRGTIRRYEIILSRFLDFLQYRDISNPADIKETTLSGFISCQTGSKTEICSVIRKLLQFWYDNGILGQDLALGLSGHTKSHHQRILSFYEESEVAVIEKSVVRNNELGKRNYAMLLLATRLGLRASDIANLKISDIDWRNNEINIIQVKTGEPATFPLLTIVGNALIDYLKYGRKSFISDGRIFHSMRPPFGAMTGPMVSQAITHVIEESGISIDGRRHGPHAMRHSLATNMRQKQVSLPIISEVLGHKSTQTTTVYVSVDIPSLMECSNDIPLVPPEFYQIYDK